jgi:Holliday junction DNA helicase RuvA
MISRLTGTIAHTDLKYVVLDVQGVGYKIATTSDTTSKLGKEDQKVTLWTYLAVRENSMDLYGFSTLEELNFFELLITISGIGPKTALGILNAASIHSLETAVQTGDISHITKVSGIGKKVAEKIIMELKDKVSKTAHTPESKKMMRDDADVIEALRALGYRDMESREVLKEIDKSITSPSAKIKAALKLLGQK